MLVSHVTGGGQVRDGDRQMGGYEKYQGVWRHFINLSILTLSSVSGCSQSASPFRQCFWDISDLHPAKKTEKVRFGQKSKKVKSFT